MKADDLPPGYVQAIDRAFRVMRLWVRDNPTARPAFRLGPPELWIAAPLRALAGKVCQNEDAAILALECLAAEPGLTVAMFGIALQLAKLPVERVSLGELGLNVGSA
jgi:hypothetical protein